MLKPKAPNRNTTDISDLMLFMFITSFPANSRPLLYETQVFRKNSLKSPENCFSQSYSVSRRRGGTIVLTPTQQISKLKARLREEVIGGQELTSLEV